MNHLQAEIEFLWSRQDGDFALARRPTLGFVQEGERDHLVCVVALPAGSGVKGVAIEALDAAGNVVSRQVHDDFTGKALLQRESWAGWSAVGVDVSGLFQW